MYSRTVVNCSRALTGNYGQIQLDRRDVAGGGQPGSAAQLSNPSAPPPTGVPAAQRGTAEQLRQRAFSLIDRNDYRDAIPLLLQAGRMGDARSQATLGIAYQDGNGVKPDDRAAAYWFSAAAAQGHRAAQYALASMYEEGDGGLRKDQAKATELYIKSAAQGFDKAQMVMGLAYEVGEGVPRSRPQAIALLRESGLGVNIAAVLSARDTPARFADLNALGNYLRKLRDEETARSTANANATLGHAGSGAYQEYFNHNSDYWRQRSWEERPH
jgi:TPR repeat protein